MEITKYFSDGRPKEIRKSVDELSDEECAKFCYNHLETVSKHTGIKLDLLRKMPGKSQMKGAVKKQPQKKAKAHNRKHRRLCAFCGIIDLL